MLRLKRMVIRSKLDTSIKKDFMEYLSSDDDNAIEALRQLVYNFRLLKKQSGKLRTVMKLQIGYIPWSMA